MRYQVLSCVIGGAVLAALGQLSFKWGADGRTMPADFVNAWILLGLVLYMGGTALWILALASAPLSVVYPFTALTFVLVNVLAVTVLGERLSLQAVAGTALVLAGLFLVAGFDLRGDS